MARKVFLSFLGTSKYHECAYFFDNPDHSVKTRFVQEATVSIFCNDFEKEDIILIFTTGGARRKNWLDHTWKSAGDGESENAPSETEGLESRLQKLDLPCSVHVVDIPEEITHETMWKIFAILFDRLQKEDEVVFDITHGFRSSPMLLMVLINYARLLKNIRVERILYGAFEARQENDLTPIWDLTAFAMLQEWTNAVNEFISSGASYQLERIIREESRDRNGADKQNLQLFAKHLKTITGSFSTVRGKEIYQGKIFRDFNDAIDKLSHDVLPDVFAPVAELLIEKTGRFSHTYDLKNGHNAIQWCLDHNMIQQAYTLGQEHIISILCGRFQLNYKNKVHRQIVSKTIGIINIEKKDKKEFDHGKLEKILRENIEEYSEIKNDEMINQLAASFGELSGFRNAMNHGGMADNIKPEDFRKNFIKFYDRVLQIIDEHPC